MLRVTDNIAQFERQLSNVGRRQLPFAMAQALNDTAAEVKEAWGVHLGRRLDRPTPFTRKGIYTRRATKSRRVAEVGSKTIQRGYLKWQAEGGTRRAKGRAVPVPVGIRLNKYGNMPKNALGRAIARKDTFSGNVRGVAGVFKRPSKSRRKSGGLKLLIAYEPQVQYDGRLDLQKAAAGKARQVFPRRFMTRFRQAMASAR